MIRVLVERFLKPGVDEELQKAMWELRVEAIDRDGYVSGETHRDAADPTHYVTISTWHSAEDWEAWSASAVRHAIEAHIAPMLARPERVTVLDPV